MTAAAHALIATWKCNRTLLIVASGPPLAAVLRSATPPSDVVRHSSEVTRLGRGHKHRFSRLQSAAAPPQASCFTRQLASSSTSARRFRARRAGERGAAERRSRLAPLAPLVSHGSRIMTVFSAAIWSSHVTAMYRQLRTVSKHRPDPGERTAAHSARVERQEVKS